jgi:hypothetical protein
MAVAINCCVLPKGTDEFVGVIPTETSCCTFSVAVGDVSPSALAVTELVPAATPVAMPEAGSIVAIEVLEEVQVTLKLGTTLPLL